MTTTGENKVLLRRFVEEVANTGDVDLVRRFVSEDFVDHDPAPGASPDISGIRQAFARVRVAFPDFHATLEDLVAEEDRVAYRWTFRGTQLGLSGASRLPKRRRSGRCSVSRASRTAKWWSAGNSSIRRVYCDNSACSHP